MADLLQTPQERLEREVVDWSNAVYEEAERGLADSREIKQASKLIDYLSGMQWNAKSRFGRSRPTVNRFFRHFVETVGLLTDIEPDFTVRFLQDDEESAQLQELMNEMIREWARMTDFEMELTQTVMWALVGANGYAKIQWNPNMNGGLGDVEFLPLGPLNVMSIGAGNRLQDEECVIARWPVTIEALFRTYGDLAKGVEADIGATETAGDVTRPAKIAPSSWVRLNPQLKKMLGQKGPSPRRTRYPRAMLKQFWFKDASRNETSKTISVGDTRYNWAYNVEPGELLYPRGRMIVVAGGKLLQDAPNPYWHGLIPFAKLRLIRVPWSEAGLCYSSDTEVLTRRGWLKFGETNSLDEFATRKIGTGEFEWQRSISRTIEPYSGDMYNFHSRSMDILVTPEHRMLVNQLPRALGGSTARHGETVVSAQNLARYGNHHVQIPQTSKWKGSEIENKTFVPDITEITEKLLAKAKRVGRTGMTERHARIMAGYIGKSLQMSGDDYCAFMGAFLSEGWCSKTSVHICQFEKSKGFKKYEELLTRILGHPATRMKSDFFISRKALRDHCIGFGDRAWTKWIPDEIMNATPKQISIFWEYFMLGDGSYEPKSSKSGRGQHPGESHERITTTSKRMADQLCELAQKMGYSAAIRTVAKKDAAKSFGKIFKSREQYVVSLRRSKGMTVKARKIQYDGMIYCVTVPNSILYVRRNGKPAWCGNSPMDPIALMQDIINRINGGIMDMIRASIEPKIIAPKAAFSQSVWDSLDPGAPGAKLQYNTNTPRPPEIPKPPELPAYVLTQKQDVEREQDATSGSSAINQALNKKQMPGGDSLDMIMNSRSIPIRFMGRGLTSFLTDVGTMVAGTKMQFETSKHRVQRFGAKGLTDADFEPYYGRWIKKGMKPEEFVRGVNFSIRKGSALSIEKAEEVQISFALRREGDLSRKGLYRKLGVPKNEELQIEKELLEEAQQKIMLAGEAGLLTKKPHK